MFPNLSRRIAALYIWLGLISILFLTVVTTVSVANVFTRGQLIQSPTVQIWWAIIFSASIEVNIVRLFYEAKRDNDKEAKKLGFGLIIVAGASLIIESLQQSIGFNWYVWYVQVIVGLVVSMRVIFVLFLLAREGSRLATTAHEHAQNEQIDEHALYACLVHFPAPAPVQVIQEPERDTDTKLHVVPNTKRRSSVKQTPEQRIRTLIDTNPNIPIRELAQLARVSIGTAQKYKQLAKKEA